MLNSLKRSTLFENIQEHNSPNNPVDLIIIGGGATGCGIALDASARGLKTILVEKNDFASGTSGRSTKLIHGGLRYLKQLDVALVQETGTERAIVHNLAPHLVLPKKMLMPLFKKGTYGYWMTSLGLWVYDKLAKVDKDDQRKMLSVAETLECEPLINKKGLKGGGLYAEYRTDDARLTLALATSANRKGATLVNYCEVTEFLFNTNNDTVNGVQIFDHLTEKVSKIYAKKIISAAGPWVDQLRKKTHAIQGKRLRLTKGVHIVFPRSKIPLRYTTYFDEPTGRMIFAIPRGDVTYVGTTDTPYFPSDLNAVRTSKEDANYLINAINHAFPDIKVGLSDIISSWAGLRPLIHEQGKPPSELSRKDEIFIASNGLISIAGGKLTGYRKMAQRVLDKVYEIEQWPNPGSTTSEIPLSEPAFKNYKHVENYREEIVQRLKPLGLEKSHAFYLVHNYGLKTDEIINEMQSIQDAPEIALGRAEIRFGITNEMVTNLCDYFIRRSGRAYFLIETIKVLLDPLANECALLLNWTEADKNREIEKLQEYIQQITHFPDKCP